MRYGILLSGGSDVDFMIHGIFKYSFFGHEVWITTSHVCVLFVLLILIGFAFAANRAMKKGTEVPGGFQNVVELIVEKLDGMVDSSMGKSAHWLGIYFYIVQQYRRSLGTSTAYRRLRCDFTLGVDYFCADTHQQVEVSETYDNLGRYVFSASQIYTIMGTYQSDQYHSGTDFAVPAFVRKCLVRDGNDGTGLRSAEIFCVNLAGSASCVF